MDIQRTRKPRFALNAITSVLAGTFLMAGHAYAADPAPGQQPTKLDKVEVTGSRIRRVDIETSSPIAIIDRSVIEQSGVATVGELVQQLPSIAGAATNPQVNNGGGDGAATVSLRGLGVNRTLILLNGRRVATQDVNSLPINLIERVDILKEGASAIYGSDAIGGVVNFITRKKYSGLEGFVDVGSTTKHDGQRQGFGAAWGASSDRGNIMVGLNYNKQNKVSAANRAFSYYALSLSSGSVIRGGSSRTPNGRIFIPASLQAQYGGCKSITRKAGATGSAQGDYRCYNPATDAYNYQAVGNTLLTPQERGSIFAQADYRISDYATAYTEVIHNHTKSGFEIAPLPFDARADGYTISKDNIYNPFGVDITNARYRMEALGNRRNTIQTDTDQVTGGLRGAIGQTSWNWDADVSFGKIAQGTHTEGYLFNPLLQNALGPSFYAGPGMTNPTCGTAAAPIKGCVPLDIFNLPLTSGFPDSLKTVASGYLNTQDTQQRSIQLNVGGNLFDLPAGSVSLATGAEYRAFSLETAIDILTQAQPPDFTKCQLASETCTGATNGSYNVKELYGEVFVPLLADKPGAKAINLTVGTRWSKYSNFGNTNNSKIGLEYRPVDDLLLRVSYAQVFRAPTISDLYAPPANNAATFTDPCTGLTAAQAATNPNYALACKNVPQDGTFKEPDTQVTGLITGNANLKPEHGNVLTYGIVYDPNWLKNFSIIADFWKYKLKDTIENLDPNTIAAQCLQTGSPGFCGLINRFPDGTVNVIQQPTYNLGTVDTQGVDLGLKYRLDRTPIGTFRFSLDTTYLAKFDRVPDVTNPGFVLHDAGTYTKQDGMYPRWRGTGLVNWNMGGFDAVWTVRYIHKFVVPNSDAGIPNVTTKYGATVYHNLAVGYNMKSWGTKLQLGMDNVFDKQPPILFANNVINANTDVRTFDTIGRYVWVRLTQNF